MCPSEGKEKRDRKESGVRKYFMDEIKRAFAAQRAHGLSVAPAQMIFELSV